MKNDVDFIKDAFASDGVRAPDTLSEELVAQRLQNAEPVKVKHSKRAAFGIASAAAAGVALVTATALLVTNVLSGHPDPTVKRVAPLYGTAKLTRFQSREEVEKTVRSIQKTQEEQLRRYQEKYAGRDFDIAEEYAAAGSAESGVSSDGAASSHNSTYVQYTGVDEADKVKTDGSYLYYLTNEETYDESLPDDYMGMNTSVIEIYHADGKDTKLAAKISAGEQQTFQEFYVNDGRLILLSTVYSPDDWTVSTEAAVYDLADPAKPKQLDSFRQSGSYVSSRMIGHELYMISNDASDSGVSLPVTCDGGATEDEVPANEIYAVENPSETNFLVVSSVDTENGAQMTNVKAILGSASDIYCNQDHLYAMAPELEPLEVDGERWSNYWVSTYRTQLIKIDLKNDLDVKASCFVRGSVNNQYSLDEYKGDLRVATTSMEDGVEVNNLYVLGEELEPVGEVSGFAPTESVKAVRYMGDTAYVITYEQTDPLFVIDLSEPSRPEILGAVKISGFSTLLVPVDENTILGIGYHTADVDDIAMEVQNGIKLVIFDVTDRANPVVRDTKIYEGCGSAVQMNPKALLVNPERGDYTIPYYKTDASNGNVAETGVINFRVTDGRLEIVDEYVSDVFKNAGSVYSGVQRCVYIGDTVYLLGDIYRTENNKRYPYERRSTGIDCVKYK